MTSHAALQGQGANQDREIWNSLCKAIANSSGFKRWQKEQGVVLTGNLDSDVRLYLEETLETLAY